MKTGFKTDVPKKTVKKGYAEDVNVVNTPTVKINHTPDKSSPTLCLTSSDLPEIKDWEVGKKYTLTLKVEQTSKGQDNEYGLQDPGNEADKNKINARFNIIEAKGVKT